MSSSDSSNDGEPYYHSEGTIVKINNKYASVRPSSYEEEQWIYAVNATQRNNRVGFLLSGKWLIFPSRASVDDVWNKIRTAVVDGKLGPSAKVASKSCAEEKGEMDLGFRLYIDYLYISPMFYVYRNELSYSLCVHLRSYG